MAERQITVKYKTPLHIFGTTLMCVLFPALALLGLAAMFMSVISINPVLFGAALASLIASFVGTVTFLDFDICISDKGFSFPLLLMPFLQFRRDRKWNDVKRVCIVGNKLTQRIEVHFTSGGFVPVFLCYLSEKDIDNLLTALEVWGRAVQNNSALELLRDRRADKKPLDLPSFTTVWEDEMSRRFSSTTFVPLSPEYELKGGRIRVLKQFAFGGLSAIYLVTVNGNENAVLKEFVVPASDEDVRKKAEELFNREAQILAKLSHPQIAKVRDHFVENGRTYVLLDYIEGTDLRKLVSLKGAQSEHSVINWAIQLAELLTYLHGQEPPVIHRDITPDNVVITKDGTVFLIDFGAANQFVGNATGTLVGKQGYISPEQFRGETTCQSDIYSLGATMHFLLTGQEPVPLSESSPIEINSEISFEINSCIRDCTKFDASERTQTAKVVLNRLVGISNDRTKSAIL